MYYACMVFKKVFAILKRKQKQKKNIETYKKHTYTQKKKPLGELHKTECHAPPGSIWFVSETDVKGVITNRPMNSSLRSLYFVLFAKKKRLKTEKRVQKICKKKTQAHLQ